MKLNPKSFYTLPEDFCGPMREMSHSPFILVKPDGQISWGKEKEGKDGLLMEYKEKAGDLMLFSWAGKYSTDMFIVTAADLKKHYFWRYSATSKIEAKRDKLLAELQALVDSL